MVMLILVIIIAILLGICLFQQTRYENLYDNVTHQLDQILSEKKLKCSPHLNTRESAIASQLIELNRQMNLNIEVEKISKEKINQFISDLSHQIRTPLTNVVMYNEILAQTCNYSDEESIMQDRISKQLEKINWILQSLFKSVYLEENFLDFEISTHPIKPTISEAISSVYPKIENKNLNLVFNDSEDILVLHNKKWTIEALVNILENSIKYSPAGSTISISLNHGEFYTEISIIDQGIGIDNSEIPEIFKRFYRSKAVIDIEGSGIGLYLVKTILENEKGYVTVQSSLGKGTKVSLFMQNHK